MAQAHRLGYLILVALLVLAPAGRAPVARTDGPDTLVLLAGPYLQSVTTNAAIICWRTDLPGDSVVEYGLTPSLGQVVSNPALVEQHVVRLTGLAPYTRYHYRIRSGGQVLHGPNSFRTAADGGQTAFHFAAYGDSRCYPDRHGQVIASMLDASDDFDFAIHTGDFVNAGQNLDEWWQFFRVAEPVLKDTPLWPTLGNHEWQTVLPWDPDPYIEIFSLPGNERWYAFDYGHVHFVCLAVDGHTPYGPGSDQYQWLVGDLAANDKPWTIVFFHVSPYGDGDYGNDPQVIAVLVPVFEQYEVDLVISGHHHLYDHSVVNGIHYLVSGGGGAPLKACTGRNPYSVYCESTLHFLDIRLDGMRLTCRGVRPDGSAFDPVLLDKGGTVPPTSTPTPTHTPSTRYLISYRVLIAPNIDADAGDWSSEGALQMNANTANHSGGSQPHPSLADLSVRLRSRWDSDALYFLWEVTDDILRTDSGESYWHDDEIELALDGEPGSDPPGRAFQKLALRIDALFSGPAGVIRAVRTHATGYMIELAVPQMGFRSNPLQDGDILGFNAGVHDDDDGGSYDTWMIWGGNDINSYASCEALILRDPWVTQTPMPSATPTATWTATQTPSRTATPSLTETTTPSATRTATRTMSSTETPTETVSPTETASATRTETPTPSATLSETASRTSTATVTETASPTETASATTTLTPSATPSPTDTWTPSGTVAPTPTPSGTPHRIHLPLILLGC